MTRALQLCLLSCVLASPCLARAGSGRPDLAVDRLEPASLCVGETNRVTVTVVNRGDAPTRVPARLVLTVQLPGHPPSFLRSEVRPLDPGGRLAVPFDGIVVERPADVLLRAEVDPEGSQEDVERSNNVGSVLIPATGSCGGTRGARAPRAGAGSAALRLV